MMLSAGRNNCNNEIPEYSILPPHREDCNYLGDGGSLRLKHYLKKCLKLNWNFQVNCAGGMEISWTIQIIGCQLMLMSCRATTIFICPKLFLTFYDMVQLKKDYK